MSETYDLSGNEYFKGLDLANRLDPLTGVLNRAAIEDYVNWLIANKQAFSYFLADIDNFKNVNDTFGHLVGDKVIEQTAKRFVGMAGDEAVVGRFGGDEFIIVRRNITDYKEVWNYAHQALDMRTGKFICEGLPNIPLTVTIGISRYPTDADSYRGILELADKALYRGKTKGRNCFIIYLPEKHAHLNLQGERDKHMKLMQQCISVFTGLTACGEDLSVAVRNTFKWLILNYMFDHICLESPARINHSVIFKLSQQKGFTHIDTEKIDKLCTSDYVNLNSVEELASDSYAYLSEQYKKQNVRSTLYCKVSAYGKEYGYIRVETTNKTRVWQNEEISMVIVVAKTLGLMLYYQNKTLDDLPAVQPITIENAD